MLGWGGVGGWGMFTYLVLRTWSIATLLRSLGSFTTLHVATLLMGWGGGVGDVHVPCTSYMIHCYAAEISGIVYYVTCCYAADGVGGGGVGDVNVPCTSYMILCYAAEISGIVYYVTCCYAADGVGWGVGDVHVPCTSYMIHCYAAEISGIVYYVTCCYAADGVGWGGGGCSRTLYFVHDPLLRCWDLWDRLLRHMLLRCWWGGVGGWAMFTYLVLRTWSIATLLRSLGSFTTSHVATLLMGWGGGVGDVHVPCTSYMIHCYAAEISGIVYYVTCCYAAEISGIVYYVTCCYAADGVGWGGWGMFTYLVLRTWSIATLLRSLGSFTTSHVATLLMGWGGGVGDVHVPCTSYMILTDGACSLLQKNVLNLEPSSWCGEPFSWPVDWWTETRTRGHSSTYRNNWPSLEWLQSIHSKFGVAAKHSFQNS